MSVILSDGSLKQGMAATLALIYLDQLDVSPQIITNSDKQALILGRSKSLALRKMTVATSMLTMVATKF